VTVLEAVGLRKSFGGVAAVDGVSLSVQAGEMLALIGPNGAGKSTCFNMLNGQIRPDAGQVRLMGQDIAGLPPRQVWRLGVGRTFQVTATFGSMTVLDNVRMALLSHHRRLTQLWRPAKDLYDAEAAAALAQVGLADQANRSCGVLAYGDLKRLELAVALANTPRLLLMDEPTAGMAPAERSGLMALTARIAKGRGIAVLFTEHDMDVVFGHADRVLVLHQGQVITAGTPAAVRADARVREVYLGPEPS
jgi:branched-chain amino acid transport system ATP-binding protein